MAKQLILFPFGGNAREALISALDSDGRRGEWDILGFVDDDISLRGKESLGVKVLGGREVFSRFPGAMISASPGNPRDYLTREKVINGLNIPANRYASIFHPSAAIAPGARIGVNCVLMPNVVISCGVTIGNHCVILPNTVVSHDSIIGNFCCVGSNVSISGNVAIGNNCYIGSGVNVRDNIKIGDRSLIGIGANVISDVRAGVVAAGNPARELRKIKQ